MEKYFADEPLTAEEISTGLRKVVAEGAYVPVLVTSTGSELIGLDVVVDMLVQIVPSPADRPFTAEGPKGEETFA